MSEDYAWKSEAEVETVQGVVEDGDGSGASSSHPIGWLVERANENEEPQTLYVERTMLSWLRAGRGWPLRLLINRIGLVMWECLATWQ